jgi:hypothetical protein
MKLFCFASLIITLLFAFADSALALDTTDDGAGIISAHGQNLPDEGMAKAFDNNNTTKWLDFSPSGSWIQYQYAFDKRSVVTSYTLTSANDSPERDPKNWNLLGSNDGGATWVTLDTRTNQTFASRFQKLSFSFTNSTAYNIYRLEITALNGPNPNSVQLAEIELIGTPPAPPVQSSSPNPTDGATNIALNKILKWTSGSAAASHDVYFGTALSDVTNTNRLLGDLNGNGNVEWDDVAILCSYWLANPAGTEPYAGINTDNSVDFTDFALLAPDWGSSAGPVFKDNQDANSYNPGALALNTTYYWRVDEVNGPDTIIGNVWSFTTQSGKAYNPNPANGTANAATNTTLSWSAGAGATSHNVYFGTTNPPASQGNQGGTTFNPGALANSTTYYWRIDEVGSFGTVTGDLWNFTTVPLNSTPIYQYLTWRNDPTNSVVVNWYNATADGDSTVDYGTTAAYGTTVNVPTISRYHHVELTGLTAGQTYHYRCRSSDGTIGTDATYTVPVASPSTFRFAVYGDPRSTNGSNQYYARHQALCNWLLAQNYDFELETGDTVWAGATYKPPQPDEYSLQVYWPDFFMLESNLSKSKVIMPTLGNHEVQDAQDYTNYGNFYTAGLPTNGISGNLGRNYSFNYGNAHFVCLSSYQISLSTQATWLSTDLAAAAANPNIKWIFAFMHAPMYTTNTSRPNRTDEISAWGPIFDTYHADIVFAGHNHTYERSKSIKAGSVVADGVGTVYLTTGLGGAEFNAPGSGSPGLFAYSYGSNTLAAVVTITGNTLNVQAITNTDGAVKDTFSLTK